VVSGVAWQQAAQRVAVQPPRARWEQPSKKYDLAREAVGCMGVFGNFTHVAFT